MVCAFSLASCSESDNVWDPYANWKARNEAWYVQITDSARTAISQAKRQYGDAWEEHCDWRQFKTLRKAADYDTGNPCDSVCVHIIKRGTREGEDAISPYSNDTVRLSFRGFLMETEYEGGLDGGFYKQQLIFDQSYYGEFNEETAAPALMPVAALTEGFYTALQYMVPGDDWLVYVPQQMAYGAKATGAIPAYSTLLFRINLAAVYRAGSGVPGWK